MGNQSAPNNQQPVVNNEPEKKHPLTALAFLEIGIFEIVFVIVGVLLLLGTINYFNLLPVSEVFPKYLGWLPRQQAKLASQGETLHLAASKGYAVWYLPPHPNAYSSRIHVVYQQYSYTLSSLCCFGKSCNLWYL